ncbi:hypothetical protein IFM89_027714 [Coptis chinensis]|uniref:Cytochrome P450 n=1 Tax=Coptis chinensis TaxID=261450 RepID=A0A835LT75_9MAGN|nr:hypothetical protein IFM89_027714 [Coptis chinensis]
MELSVFSMNNLLEHIKLSDILLALLGLFIFSSLVQRFGNKGPMLWPVMGIIPIFLVHLDNIYDWVTNSLITSGGSFYYQGMWMGGAHGIVTISPSNISRQGSKTSLKESTSKKGSVIYSVTVSSMLMIYCGRIKEKPLTQRCIAISCLAVEMPYIPFTKAFEKATEFTLFRFLVPPFVWKLMKFFNIGSERKLKRAIQVVHEFAEMAISERRNENYPKYKSDLLTRLLDVKKNPFTNTFLKDFCVSFILAGRDTSSVALAWFFWLIHEHQHVENQILDELSSIVRARKTDENTDDSLLNGRIEEDGVSSSITN